MNSALHHYPAREPVPTSLMPASAALIILFWVMYVGSLTWQRLIAFPDQGFDFMLPRVLVSMIGVAFSFGMFWLQGRTATWQLGERIAVASAAALLGGASHSLCNVIIFSQIFSLADPFNLADFMIAALDWIWYYLTLSLVLLALRYSFDIAERERRLEKLAATGRAAQIRALRYQLNPHFLFNTLNSIAALVRREQDASAEAMVENLSDFLRTGLALDPHDHIPLDRELELQASYLDIERQRFPDRLEVDIDAPEHLRGAAVPALITQPLIENAIKYAVARSSVPVRISISAREADGQLELRVSDDGGNAPPPEQGGTKVGLANVQERLKAQFGGAYRFEAGPLSGGGFAVTIALPLKLPEQGR